MKRQAAFLFLTAIHLVAPESVVAQLSGEAKPRSASNESAVFERLLLRLSELAGRWGLGPPSSIARSGRSAVAVVQTASEVERQAARGRLERLLRTPGSARSAEIGRALRAGELTELDLWLPLDVAETVHRKDRYAEAAEVTEVWLELAEAAGRQDALARAAGFGLYLSRLRMPPGNVVGVATALSKLKTSAEAVLGSAAIQDEYGGLLFRLGQNEGALVAHRKARALYEQAGDTLGQGNTWRGEAKVLMLLGQTDGALVAYRKARALYEQVGSAVGQGHTWTGEAKILSRVGQTDGALLAYSTARGLFEKADDGLSQGNTWRGQADVLYSLRKNQGALVGYRKARALFEKADDATGQGNTWNGEANVLFELGQNEGALVGYRKARALFEKVGEIRSQGYTWKGEANVLSFCDQNEGALVGYRKARLLLEQGGDALGQGYTWDGEADVLLRLGQNEGALVGYRKARALFNQGGDTLGQGYTWINEAEVLLALAQPRAALRAVERALKLTQIKQEVGGQYNAQMVRLRALQTLRRQEAAEATAEAMLPLAEKLRGQGITDWDRRRRAEQVTTPYDVLVPAYARKAGGARRALEIAESAHAPVLRSLLRAGDRSAQETPRPYLQQALQELQKERAEQADRMRRRTLGPADAEASWHQLEARYEEVYREALVTLPPQVDEGTLNYAQMQQLVQQTGPVLLYYGAPQEVIAFLVQPGAAEPVVKRIGLNREKLGEAVKGLRKDLGNGLFPSRAEQRQRVLGDLLLEPFARKLRRVKHVRVVGHGPLHQLPFEALRPGGKRLGYAVSMAPSMWVLKELHRRQQALPAEESPPLVALASGEGLQLPGPEINKIAEHYGSNRVLVYPEGSDLGAYQKLAPRARHLLIASHGVQEAGSLLGTYIELLPTARTDGRLSSVDIAETKLPNAELVTLAACDTARAEAALSDERLDLTRAYLVAGAAAVLGTRWRVPETESTTRFLVDFYRLLRKGGEGGNPLRKDEALKRAREEAQDRGEATRQWAAWVLIGDGG